MQPTIVTWSLVLFGLVTLIPLMAAQSSMLINPDGEKTRDMIIGKGENWRDKTHFKLARGGAWADWLLLTPLFLVGSAGMLLGNPWG